MKRWRMEIGWSGNSFFNPGKYLRPLDFPRYSVGQGTTLKQMIHDHFTLLRLLPPANFNITMKNRRFIDDSWLCSYFFFRFKQSVLFHSYVKSPECGSWPMHDPSRRAINNPSRIVSWNWMMGKCTRETPGRPLYLVKKKPCFSAFTHPHEGCVALMWTPRIHRWPGPTCLERSHQNWWVSYGKPPKGGCFHKWG